MLLLTLWIKRKYRLPATRYESLNNARQIGASIAIINGGDIRASISRGTNHFSALENGVSNVEEVQGRFPQVAGLKFTWDTEAKLGSRIVPFKVETDGIYEPISHAAIYCVVANGFFYHRW